MTGDVGGSRAAGAATRRAPVPGRRYKRAFDLAVTGIALCGLSPLWLALGLAAAAAIRLEDNGPVLYRQARLGRGGRIFFMLKFRSMAVDAECGTGPVWARAGDVRCTRVGRVLRRFHVDELPQLVNVLRGEMSLVGPRPERPALAARIQRELPAFAGRLAVRPGLAGLAQSRGRYRAVPRNKLRYDRLYIGAMGPGLDLKLLAACVWRAVRGPVRRGIADATAPVLPVPLRQRLPAAAPARPDRSHGWRDGSRRWPQARP